MTRPVVGRSYDVVVAGAGMVGAACAEAAAREGLRVLVVEPDIPGGGATAAGMGHLVVMDDSAAQFELTRYSCARWRERRNEFSERAEFREIGTLWIAASDEDTAAARRKGEFFRTHGVAAEWLDAQMLAECEPDLRPGLAGGLLVAQDAVIYAPSAAQSLLDRARDRGARIIRDAVVGMKDREVSLRSGSRVPAAACVVASGDAARQWLPDVPLVVKKGHLLITDRFPHRVRHQLVELGYLRSAHGNEQESVAFNAQPRETGQILLGSSRQVGVATRDVDWPILRRMIRRGIGYLPELASVTATRVWTGWRESTPDALPIIGEDARRPGLILATGHEGLGVTTSLGTADLVVSLLLGRPSPIRADPYLPSRFAIPS